MNLDFATGLAVGLGVLLIVLVLLGLVGAKDSGLEERDEQ